VATNASIKIVKSSAFKGGTRTWSNRYHFNGTTPPDNTHWTTLSDAIVTAEKAQYPNTVTITQAVGYAAGSDVPVFTKTYSTVGTLTPGGSDTYASGEVAALVRYSTAARTSKNHPIYCFSYYHHALVGAASTTADTLASGQKTAMGTYATAWVSGFSDGTVTHVRATPNSQPVTGSAVETYVTHRDFPHTPSL